jgi:hypothetical protein
VQVGEVEVHLGDVDDPGAHGPGELLAQGAGVLRTSPAASRFSKVVTLTVRPLRRSTIMLRLQKPGSSWSLGIRFSR